MDANTYNTPKGWRLASTMGGLMLALFLAALDTTIIGTALPRVVADLDGFDHYAWVATAYLLTSAASIPVISKLSDVYGRKWLLIIVVVGFVGSSALCGAAQSMAQLIVFRGVQGLFGGGLFSLAFSGVADLFPPRDRGKWFGLFFSMFGVASIIGPFLGGVITEYSSWRWTFYVNVPVGIAALAVLFFGYPATGGNPNASLKTLDYAGAILVVVFSTSLLLGITFVGQPNGFTPGTVGLFGLAIASGAAFIAVERRAADPLLPLDLFRYRAVGAGVALNTLVGFLQLAMIINAPLYAQAVLGDSPAASGATLTPLLLTFTLSNTVVGQAISRWGRYKPIMLLGVAVLPLGATLLLLLNDQSSRWLLLAALFFAGVGLSLFTPTSNIAVQNVIPRARIGAGTGMTTFARTIGQSLGAGIVGAIVIASYTALLPQKLPASAQTLPPAVVQTLTSPDRLLSNPETAGVHRSGEAALPAGVDARAATEIQDAVRQAIAGGLHHGFWALMVVVLIICAIGVVWMPDMRLAGGAPHDGPRRASERPTTPVAPGSSAAS